MGTDAYLWADDQHKPRIYRHSKSMNEGILMPMVWELSNGNWANCQK